MRPHLWKTKLTANNSEAKEQLGTIRLEYDSAGNLEKIYRYIKNGTTGTLANGDVVVWDLTTDDAYTVKTIGSANVLYSAGVCIGDISASYFGWIQVGGVHSKVKIGANVTAGNAVGTSATDKKAGPTTTAGAKMGFAYNDVTAGTDTVGKVFLMGLI